MKTLKLISILVLAATFCGAGAALADDDYRRGPRRHYYGPPAYRCAPPPRPVYVERHYHYAPPPVVVERHYVVEPVRYVAPYPSGFFFGLSFADRRSGFSFGFAGR